MKTKVSGSIIQDNVLRLIVVNVLRVVSLGIVAKI